MNNALINEDEYEYEKVKGKGSKRAAASAFGESIGGGADVSSSLSAAGMASGNPYAMAGGLGLAVLSQARREKRAQEELKAKMELDRLGRQDAALSRLVNISQGLRNL